MKKIFWNYSEQRLRTGWRIVISLMGFIIVMISFGLILKVLGKNIVTSLVGLVAFGTLTIVVFWIAGRYIDKRSFKDFGFNINKNWWRDFVFGFLLSGVLISIIFIVEKSFGWINIVGVFKNEKELYINFPFAVALIIGLLAYSVLALWEEVFFRGYFLKNLSEGLNNNFFRVKGALILAFIISSVFFGMAHFSNPNITIIGIINIILLGIFLGLPYVLTGELAIPIALHISWNFFQGLIFGFPLSGGQDEISVFSINQSGPEIWTGDAFGPEAGLFSVFAMLVGCGIIILWIRVSRGRISLHTSLAEYRNNR